MLAIDVRSDEDNRPDLDSTLCRAAGWNEGEPMIAVRRARERGHTILDWLDSWHSFSFDQYYDPSQMGFSHLRVLNEDWVAPGRGFGMHSHRDMEIITWVLEGDLAHCDSLGNGSTIRPGEIQRMTAGTGITHSEINPSEAGPLHLLQIWIRPDHKGLVPGYEQREIALEERRGRLRLVASRDGRQQSVTIHQDAKIFAASLQAPLSVVYPIHPGRHVWLQVARGGLTVDSCNLSAGDGAAVSEQEVIEISASEAADFLLFDLA